MQKFTGMVAVAAVAGLAMSASASIKTLHGATSIPAVGAPHVLRGTGFTGTGWEASEGFANGDINGQQGWVRSTAGALNVGPTGNGSANALVGTRGAGLGTTHPLSFAVSPLISLPSAVTAVDVDVKIDDDFGANYFAIGSVLNTTSGNFDVTWRVEFDYRGDIFVVDPTNPLAVSGFVDTNTPWNDGGWKHLRVEIGATQIQYFYDNVLFHTGGLVTPGQTATEEVILGHDNFQDISNGSFSGGPVAGYFDNLQVTIPAPGSLALVGLGGLLAARRRRA